jgi:hypothetical protein
LDEGADCGGDNPSLFIKNHRGAIDIKN